MRLFKTTTAVAKVLFCFLVFDVNVAFASNVKDAAKIKQLSITPQTTMASINALSDDAKITTPEGKVVTARQYKKMAQIIKKIQKLNLKGAAETRGGFSKAPSNATLKINNGVNLQEVAKRSDSDVLELPDGRKITVGDLRKLSEVQRKLRGKALLDMAPTKRPSRSGKALKVYSREDLKKFSSLPDSTILETANGKRITLGELRAFAKTTGTDLGVGK